MVSMPAARGDLSELLIGELAEGVHPLPASALPAADDPLSNEDLQLSLYLCYELHYRGLPGADERWEWEPSLLSLRHELEQRFEGALLDAVGQPGPPIAAEEIDLALREVVEADDGPSLAGYLSRQGTLDQVLEFIVHRSAYHLKEADPHSWAIPRLSGAPKAALVEVQADEYGGGRSERNHAEMFARTMQAVGLDHRYGAYVDRIPAVTLATVNLMSFLGLHRRWRGGIVGHLALFEMTSSVPNRRYGNALRRLGFDTEATAFFDEHVEADAVHENIAAVDLAGGLVRQEPEIGGSILWGARALAEVDARWARHLLDAWESGRSSLLEPLAAATA